MDELEFSKFQLSIFSKSGTENGKGCLDRFSVSMHRVTRDLKKEKWGKTSQKLLVLGLQRKRREESISYKPLLVPGLPICVKYTQKKSHTPS